MAPFHEELIPLNARRRKIPSQTHLPAKTTAPPPIPPARGPTSTPETHATLGSVLSSMGSVTAMITYRSSEGEPKRLGRPIGTIDEDPDLDLAEEPEREEETEDGYDGTSARLVPDKKGLKNAPLFKDNREPIGAKKGVASSSTSTNDTISLRSPKTNKISSATRETAGFHKPGFS